MRVLLFYGIFYAVIHSARVLPPGEEEIPRHLDLREIEPEPHDAWAIRPSESASREDAPFQKRRNVEGPSSLYGDDPEPQLTTAIDTTTGTKRPGGFFKGIEDFFKRSFHMDKTTLPIHATTAKSTGNPEATRSSVLHPPLLVLQDQSDAQSREDPARGRGRDLPLFRNKQPQTLRGRDATFNFRIKAVAIPK